MDQNALKFIKDRQVVLKDAYNSYKRQFPASKGSVASKNRLSNGSTSISGERRKWGWCQWNDNDINEIITDCLEKESNLGGKPGAIEPNYALKEEIRRWIEDFLSDTGSTFRLYRKGGFEVDNAILALRDTLKFRIQYRRELLWLPVPREYVPEPSDFVKEGSPLLGSKSSRRSSASSRTSAQSPRASPAPPLDGTTDSLSLNHTKEETSKSGARGSTETLIQLYPHSSMDPNRRPIIVVSLKYISDVSNSTNELDIARKLSPSLSAPAKTQALAAFERLRCHLAENASADEQDESKDLDPLQFILIIDLASGRVSATAWDMVKWLVRDGADQFHGMCSSVFVVNYSWEFGALWSFIKHMLPAPARARVMFPRVEELLEYLGKDTLPPSLGGSCTSTLPYYPSPLTACDPGTRSLSSTHSPAPNAQTSLSLHNPGKPLQAGRTSLKYLHSTSHENPYYGYPATIEEGVDSHGRPVRIQHSRKRKRDLVRTLMWLLLLRCRERIAYLPRQLKNLGRKTIHGRWSTLIILTVVTVLVSLTRTKEWHRWQNSVRRRLVGRLK